ncbi:hypothetical protein [Aquibium microcysteis]|nr:hypothetical protein [Aquibium microcysteis]
MAGLSYDRVKLALYHIMMETTQAPYEARFLAARLQWPEPAP